MKVMKGRELLDRILQMKQEKLTQGDVAEKLSAEGYTTITGGPLKQMDISKFIQTYRVGWRSGSVRTAKAATVKSDQLLEDITALTQSNLRQDLKLRFLSMMME